MDADRRMKYDQNFRKLAMEVVGVFLICYICGFVGLWSIHGFLGTEGSALLGPITIYMVVMVGAQISGAHYNPAVTFVMYMIGEISKSLAIEYIIAQMVGSLAAGMVLSIIKPAALINNPNTSRHLGQCEIHPGFTLVTGFFTEFIATGILLFAVMGTMHKKLDTPSMASLITLVIGCNGLAFGNATSCCMNPARTFGPSLFAGAILDRGSFIYYTAPMLGGYCGAMLYRLIFNSQHSHLAESKLNDTHLDQIDHNNPIVNLGAVELRPIQNK